MGVSKVKSFSNDEGCNLCKVCYTKNLLLKYPYGVLCGEKYG